MKKIINFYKKLTFMQGAAFALTFTSVIAIATTVAPLTIFSPGTTISSAQINTNFNNLKTAVESTSAQTYLGTHDASTAVDPSGSSSGDYYIITTAGTINAVAYAVGDWIIFNGTIWQKVPSSTAITTVFGRTGAIGPAEGDYTLNHLADVNTTSPTALNGSLLKFDGSQWRASQLPTCAGGEVLKSDGVLLTCVTDNTGGGAFTGPSNKAVVTDGAGNLTTLATTSTELGHLSGVTSAIQPQLDSKEPMITASTTSKYYRGDKTFQTLDTTAVVENTNFYFTDARARNATLVGFSALNAAITSADTILVAFNKTQGQLNDKLSAFGGVVSSGTLAITGAALLTVPTPVSPPDAVNKGYVDSFGQWNKVSSDIYYMGGNVGIGTSSPGSTLHVVGTSTFNGSTSVSATLNAMSLQLNNPGTSTSPAIAASSYPNTGVFFPTSNTMAFSSSGVERMRVDAGGNVGIGTTAPAYKLEVNGQIASSMAFMQISDMRFKENISIIPNALQNLLKINGVSYDFKVNDFKDIELSRKKQLGVIAQTVEKVFPEAVNKDAKGFRTVAYSMLIAPIIEAIREVNSKTEKLEAENKMLKSYLCAQDPHAPFCE